VLVLNSARKADKDLYNDASEDFIPIACHYDENTLLTKNGELIQIIQINGINAEHVSKKLFNLRETVRSALKKNIEGNNYAFWLHTVRRKTNLDDDAPYNKILSANLHDVWRKKNYWDDKFVNTLYISIIYDSAEVRTKNLTSLLNSLVPGVVRDFQNKYLADAYIRLNGTVNKILSDLEEYGAQKLGIRFEEDRSFSDMVFLYRRITHLNEDSCLVPLSDLSSFLASQRYAVGGDKIEVISEQDKKFAAMLSIKEYQDVSADALDTFLQLPVELIATEVFYFVDKKTVISKFEDQDYILKVSGDTDLRDIKGTARMASEEADARFCKQQISIAIIGDDLNKLDQDMSRASRELSKIGIVHVREDINLEQTFWAQLPGNFTFLRRMSPTVLSDTAALASLHNFPTGNQTSPWGKAITLLRTEKGTPYFMNFHTNTGQGNTCIMGSNGTGKTIITNFLISESLKFEPTIIYLSNNNDSQIFIESVEGKWDENSDQFINPFLCEDTEENRKFLCNFLQIICNHYVIFLNDAEIEFLQSLVEEIFSLEEKDRTLSNLMKTADFSSVTGIVVKQRLSCFDEGKLYHGIFDRLDKFELYESQIIGFNLYKFTDKYFTDKFYPEDLNQVEQFESDLLVNLSVCTSMIFALNHFLTLNRVGAKILVLDNMNFLLKPKYFSELIKDSLSKLASCNGVMLGNINLYSMQSEEPVNWQIWQDLIDTKIILPSDIKIEDLKEILDLSKAEYDKLLSLTLSSRRFLIKQDNQSIVAELSIGGLAAFVRILSAKAEEMEVYKKILAENPGPVKVWIDPLYKALESYKTE
jgi:type IV secretion system protein VirB4